VQRHVVRPLNASPLGHDASLTSPIDELSTSFNDNPDRSTAVLPSASLSCTATSTVSRPLTAYTEVVRSTARC